MNSHGLGSRAGAGQIGIDWLLYRPAVLKFIELLDEQVKVDGVGVVEVDLLPVLEQGDVAVVLVVGVLGDNNDLSSLEVFRDLLDHCGLA